LKKIYEENLNTEEHEYFDMMSREVFKVVKEQQLIIVELIMDEFSPKITRFIQIMLGFRFSRKTGLATHNDPKKKSKSPLYYLKKLKERRRIQSKRL